MKNGKNSRARCGHSWRSSVSARPNTNVMPIRMKLNSRTLGDTMSAATITMTETKEEAVKEELAPGSNLEIH